MESSSAQMAVYSIEHTIVMVIQIKISQYNLALIWHSHFWLYWPHHHPTPQQVSRSNSITIIACVQANNYMTVLHCIKLSSINLLGLTWAIVPDHFTGCERQAHRHWTNATDKGTENRPLYEDVKNSKCKNRALQILEITWQQALTRRSTQMNTSSRWTVHPQTFSRQSCSNSKKIVNDNNTAWSMMLMVSTCIFFGQVITLSSSTQTPSQTSCRRFSPRKNALTHYPSCNRVCGAP